MNKKQRFNQIYVNSYANLKHEIDKYGKEFIKTKAKQIHKVFKTPDYKSHIVTYYKFNGNISHMAHKDCITNEPVINLVCKAISQHIIDTYKAVKPESPKLLYPYLELDKDSYLYNLIQILINTYGLNMSVNWFVCEFYKCNYVEVIEKGYNTYVRTIDCTYDRRIS